jgi:hypothetical protein
MISIVFDFFISIFIFWFDLVGFTWIQSDLLGFLAADPRSSSLMTWPKRPLAVPCFGRIRAYWCPFGVKIKKVV